MEVINQELSMDMIDNIINQRLANQGIVSPVWFSKFDSPNELAENIEIYLRKRCPGTILGFYKNCGIPLIDVFSPTKQDMLEDDRYLLLCLVTGSIVKAIKSIDQNSSLEENPLIESLVPKLFDKNEIKAIARIVIKLLTEFPEQIERCERWLCEHKPLEKQQVEMAKDCLTVFIEDEFKRTEKSQNAAVRFLNEWNQLSPSLGRHNLVFTQAQEKAGMDPSGSDLIFINIQRIFTYLEICHYAGGVFDWPANDEKEINFYLI